jgi:hypothetical protein
VVSKQPIGRSIQPGRQLVQVIAQRSHSRNLAH